MNRQIITASDTAIVVEPGGFFDLTLTYSADSEILPGLGLKLFFDAEKLTFKNMSSVFSKGQLASDLQAKSKAFSVDGNNDDGDFTTNHFINAAWVSVDGQWPGKGVTPIDLYTVSFSVAENFEGLSGINFLGEVADNVVFEAPTVLIESKRAQSQGWLKIIVDKFRDFFNRLFGIQ